VYVCMYPYTPCELPEFSDMAHPLSEVYMCVYK
jgi:hypothetical protein